MLTFLSNIFIKNKSNPLSPDTRQSYGILCGIVGIFFNALLFAGKFFAGAISSSISITADAFNNLSDAGSSVITLIGFKMAGQKPDSDHPFGHGRIEYLSGLAVSAAILIMAFELIKTSFHKLLHPQAIAFSPVIIAILVSSILVKCYMFIYNRAISRKIQSEAMMATAMDSLSDTVATTAVLVTTLIAHFTGLKLDGICGILVGLFIMYSGISSAKDTISPLLGQAPEPEFVNKIHTIVLSNEQILGIHDLIVHNYGPGRIMISLHAEVSAEGNILELHDMIDNIERTLCSELHCDAVIHMDPVCTNDPAVIGMKETITGILSDLDKSLCLHDFRMVKGPTHTNIIFDIVLPYRFRLTDQEVRSYMEEKIKQLDSNYFAVINIDKIFS